MQAEAGAAVEQNEDVAEVERYLAATRYALKAVEVLPITLRLIKQAHEILLRGVRGEEKLPGELRRSPVWIGSSDDNPDTAVFVPPLPEHLPEVLADWEKFVNGGESQLPTLIRCALMHYQFETIHPFLDGNGRIGRLLINLLLKEEGRLDHPLLYISGYFEANRKKYYEYLQGVRENGAIEKWISFFLTAVRQQSQEAAQRALQLVQIRERYLAEASKTRGRLAGLATLIIENPYLTVQRVERGLQITNAGARNLVKEAEARGWLKVLGSIGRGGKIYWYAEEVFRIIEAPMSYPEVPLDD